ncbi:hypothetical protein [Jiangella endophytica]|uniref:hypothetical protein n=1 Tax=Jiangella endophytica TaxID=1623398 RepID=UPI000E347D08|nr:hypothetical protein [Jiangella endophytica]
MQAAALSLALQHPEADAEIVVLDLLPTDLAAAGNLAGFVRALTTTGAAVEHLRGGDVPAYLSRLTDVVEARQTQHDTTLYVVAFGLDRARRLAELDLTSGAVSTPADGLRALLRDGPPVGAHLLAWWSSVRVMREQLGFDAADTIDGLLALRISAGDVQDLFGPFTVWKPEGPRGLLHDRTESADPHVIVPFRPLSAADVRTLGDEPWDS